MEALLVFVFCLTFLGQSGKRQSGKQDNPTNTKENPADSKHVCQIVTAVTYSLSDCLWCLSDFLSSMFAGFSCMKIRQIGLNYTCHPSNTFNFSWMLSYIYVMFSQSLAHILSAGGCGLSHCCRLNLDCGL